MLGAAPWSGDGITDRVFDIDEPRAEALRYLAALLAALGWLLALLDLVVNGSDPPNVLGFVGSVWLMAVAGAGWRLAPKNVVLAGTVLASGLAAAIGTAAARNPLGPAAYLLALVVVCASATAGPRHGFYWAAIATLVVGLAARGPSALPPDSAAVALGLAWGAAIFCWLGFRPVHVAADWAWTSYNTTLRLTQELRDRQAELAQLSKSLGETCDRLEQQNVVLERARSAAEEARRLKAEFAAAISHELRTPVNLVVGVSEMMMQAMDGLSDSQLPDACREDVEVIYRNACHISHLIDDILDLSQVDAHRMGLQKEDIRLREIAEQAASALATQFARKGLYLKVDLPEDLPPVRADPTRLRQAFVNLLGNATRFTDRGGVTIGARLAEREVVCSVSDTGVGIPPEDVPCVFEEFRQASTAGGRRGGTGLGLAVTKRLVELHGGNVWATSTLGQGSAFYFSLPLVDSVAASPVSTDVEVFSRLASGGAPTLALVGADEHAARVIQRYLDDYRVVPATREQALRLVRDGRLDALLVASAAPTGQTDWPRGEVRSVPVVRCTLRTASTLAQEIGVAEYLVKPVVREQLHAALRRLRRPVRNVLIVEDDAEMRRMLARMVCAGSRQRKAQEAADGREAIEMARATPPDVVLLDLLMPGMDGQGFLEAARAEKHLRDVPVIVVSARGYESESVVASGLAITREGGLTVGEFTRALRGSLNALLSSPLGLERSAGARPGAPAA